MSRYPPAGPEAPPDPDLLAEAVEALDAGRLPDATALEELVHLAEMRPDVQRVLRKRRALRIFDQVAAKNPGASDRALAEIAARKAGELADTVRKWGRERRGPPRG